MMWLVAISAFCLSGLLFYDAFRCAKNPRLCDRHMQAMRILQGVAALGFALSYLPFAAMGQITEAGIIPMRTSMLALLLSASAEVIARWNCRKS